MKSEQLFLNIMILRSYNISVTQKDQSDMLMGKFTKTVVGSMLLASLLIQNKTIFADTKNVFLEYQQKRALDGGTYDFIDSEYRFITGFSYRDNTTASTLKVDINKDKIYLITGTYSYFPNDNLELKIGTYDTYFGLFSKDGTLPPSLLGVLPQGAYPYSFIKGTFTNIIGVGGTYNYNINCDSSLIMTHVIGTSQNYSSDMLEQSLLGSPSKTDYLVGEISRGHFIKYTYKDIFKMQLSHTRNEVNNKSPVGTIGTGFDITINRIGVMGSISENANILFEGYELTSHPFIASSKGVYGGYRYYFDEYVFTFARSLSKSHLSNTLIKEDILGLVRINDPFSVGIEVHHGNNKRWIKNFDNMDGDWSSVVLTLEVKIL